MRVGVLLGRREGPPASGGRPGLTAVSTSLTVDHPTRGPSEHPVGVGDSTGTS